MNASFSSPRNVQISQTQCGCVVATSPGQICTDTNHQMDNLSSAPLKIFSSGLQLQFLRFSNLVFYEHK